MAGRSHPAAEGGCETLDRPVLSTGIDGVGERSMAPAPPSPPGPHAALPAPGPPDDQVLLAAIGAGDRQALGLLYRAHAGWLVARLRRRCPDDELVDSALQDTFVAVWRSARAYTGQGDVGAWLWGIAVHKLVDQQRRRRPVPVADEQLAVDLHSAHPSAESAALGSTFAGGDLADALARLPVDLRAVMLATAVDGLTTAEAARLLGIPQGTVKTRLMRARALLQGDLR